MADLVTLGLETRLEAKYTFPDMPRGELTRLLASDFSDAAKTGSLTLVNVSGAALVIPFRIVKKILIDGEERWVSPA